MKWGKNHRQESTKAIMDDEGDESSSVCHHLHITTKIVKYSHHSTLLLKIYQH